MARYPTFEEYQASGKLKDGLKKCNDILKKTKPDGRLLTTKLQFLYALHLPDEAAGVLKQLADVQPTILDAEELATVDDVVQLSLQDVYPLTVTAGKAVDELWDKALKSAPASQKEILLHTRFSTAVYGKRWADAQKAMIGLKAASPTNRTYFLTHVVVTQLLSEATTDRLQKPTQARLAIAFAQKALQFTDVTQLGLDAARQVLLRQHRYEDLVKANTEMSPRDAIRCFRETKLWQDLFEYCNKLIETARQTEIDWTVWNGLIDSCGELGECKPDSEKGQTVLKYIEKTQSREASLAAIHFAFRSDKTELPSKCIAYFHLYGRERHCFSDLQRYLEAFPHDVNRLDFCDTLAKSVEEQKTDADPAESLPAEVNILKIRCLLTAIPIAPEEHDLTAAFACDAIRLFKTAITNVRRRSAWARDDACFMAVSCLFEMDKSGNDQYPNFCGLLQAALLLETLLKDDAEVHQARVALVHLYIKLNLGSLAMKHFEVLKVREIQHDTISYALMTRISLTHPHPTKGFKGTGLDPHVMAGAMLTVYDASDQKLANCQAEVLGNGQTGMLFDLNDLRDALHESITRRILSLEERRIARLTGRKFSPKSIQIYPRSVKHWTSFKETRDFNATFKFWDSAGSMLVRDAPTAHWLLTTLATDVAWCLVHDQEPPCPPAELLESLKPNPNPSNDVTSTEAAGRRLMRDLITTARKWDNVSTHEAKQHLEDLVSGVNALQVNRLTDDSALGNTNCPVPYTIREHYVSMDCLNVMIDWCAKAMAKGVEKATIEKLKTLAQEAFRRLQQHASRQKQLSAGHMPVAEILDADDEISIVVRGVVGENETTAFVKDTILATGREAWDAVARVKMS